MGPFGLLRAFLSLGLQGEEESTREIYGVPPAQDTSHALAFWGLFWDVEWEQSVSSLGKAGCGIECL